MKTAMIRLEAHDDVYSTLDKMSWSQAQRLLLVWPEEALNLGSRLDLILLQRKSRELGQQLGLIGAKGMVLTYARELGIPVFSNPKSANRSRWRFRRQPRGLKLPETKKVRDELEKQRDAAREHIPAPMTFWRRLSLFTAAVFSVFALVIFLFPSAEVSIRPVQEQQSAVLSFRASPEIPSPTLSGDLPAQELTVIVEGQDQAESTGWVQSADQYASGEVLVTNLTSQPVQIPSGTVIQTSSHPAIQFETTRAAAVPSGANSSVSIPVRARAPGTSGNVAAEKIQSIPGSLGLLVRVINPERISGGTDRRAKSPSAADEQALREKLLQSLELSARSELQAKVGDYQWLIPETVRVMTVLKEEQSAKVGTPADRLSMTLQVEYTAWVISTQHIEAIANATFASSTTSSSVPVPDSFRIEEKKTGTFEGQEANFDLTVSRRMQPAWTENQVVQAIAGTPIQDVAMHLKRKLGQDLSPIVQLTPSWWRWMPFLAFRIHVRAQ